MSKTKNLREAVDAILNALKRLVDKESTLAWKPADGIIPILKIAIIRRQYESLVAVLALVDIEKGFAAVGLLRPACEEYLWAKYLYNLNPLDAENLSKLMAQNELHDSLKAQESYSGAIVMEKMGLDKYLRKNQKHLKERKKEIAEIGKKLKWDENTIKRQVLPSISFIAKKVNEASLYKLLYHASSRYVHYSPAELLRKVWGRSGNVTANSEHFNNYWSAFVMYWGMYLLISTLPFLINENKEYSNGLLDEEEFFRAAKLFAKIGNIPIITAEELAWED